MERATSYDASIYHSDVFLSFRGPDTRQGFVDCLYHFLTNAGIQVFKDDEDLRRGERIEEVLEAVENSKICIPVFSKDYASSKWCLRELAKMAELEKQIIPIFYDVTPDDVKLRTGLYREKLRGLPERLASEKVQWEKALVEVASISGWELKNRGHGEFSKRIAVELSTKLKVKEKIVTSHLIGMEDQVEAMIETLHTESRDIRFVGIHGMGGVGKTTLAKVVFNQLHSCFSCATYLENIRETWKREGVTCLQRQLLSSLGFASGDICDCDSGIRKIKRNLHDQKVLVVLDDVDRVEQLEKLAGSSSWYGSGSRIIVTTRNFDVLEQFGEFQTMEMNGLNPVQALQLFSRHAFQREYPPADFINLSKQAALAAAGLPLALEVIGSLLRLKSIGEWKEIIKSVGTNQEIQKILMISYDSMDIRTKQIFLDIACLFIHKEKTNCIYMWEACNFCPSKGLAALISMSLVKMNNNKFWMHDLVRDLGRDIVCQENLVDLGKRSRLWTHDDSMEILQRGEGKENVQALGFYWYSYPSLRLGHEALRGLRSIRFLVLHGLVIEGHLEHHTLSNLRWLYWDGFSSKTISLNLPNLVVLEITSYEISELWSHIQMANLKVLTLRWCRSETLGFPTITRLERLILKECSSFKFDGSIGKLKRLKYLDLRGCVSLEGLPEEIGALEDLEMILMEGNGSSFSLPGTINNLKSLLVLQLDNVHMKYLPEAIGQIPRLRWLSLRGSSIENFPDSFRNLTELVELDLSGASIKELPNFYGDLKALKVLSMRNSCARELPRSIGMLEMLEALDAYNNSLEEVPGEIGQLFYLKTLNLSLTKIYLLPSTISELPFLQTLHLSDCHNLRELPKLPTSLTSLQVGSKSLQKVPDLSELINLTDLVLSDAANYIFYHNFCPPKKAYNSLFPRKCVSQQQSLMRSSIFQSSNMEKPYLTTTGFLANTSSQFPTYSGFSGSLQQHCSLDWIGSLTKLVSLHLDLSITTTPPYQLCNLSRLQTLHLSCRGWEWFPQLPSSLTRLTLGHLPTSKFPIVSNLRKLSFLGLFNFSMDGDGLERLGIKDLQWLAKVSISNGNFRELNLQHLPANLRILKLDECRSLKRLYNLSYLKELHSLQLSVCEELEEIEDPHEVALSILSIVGRCALKLKGVPIVGFTLNCRNHKRNRYVGPQSPIYLLEWRANSN